MDASQSLIFEFVSEAKEHLANIGDDLLALEQHPDDGTRYRIDHLFRAVHSIKGGAGFFGCRTIEELAHAMESLLDHARRQELSLTPVLIDTLLAGSDRILALLDDVERCNDADVSSVLKRLQGLMPSEAPEPLTAPATPLPAGPSELTEFAPFGPALAERPADHGWLYGLAIDLGEVAPRRGLAPLAVLEQLQRNGVLLDGRLDVPDGDLERGLPAGPLRYRAVLSASFSPDEFAAALALPEARIVILETAPILPPPVEPEEHPAEAAAPEKTNTLRIPVQLVDRLMTLTGELVLVRNQALRAIDPGDPILRPLAQRLDGVTSELQDAVLRTRMQPVGNLFARFPRMVRDLARQLGKRITLSASGTEVELDKSILEALSDPLTHLVRNCCDHGIEPPEDRLRVGKPEEGHISLSARPLGGQILLVVRDDGKGIDPEKVRRKAAQLGLRSPTELARMGPRELYDLILLPGFSTASQITDLSGRGVGMDVVKTNLDRLGGVLDVDSTLGCGVSFTLRLPLTLAIIPCLLVRCGTERYAIPQKDLDELVCLHPALGRSRIEYAFDQEVLRLRERLLPLVRLEEVLRRRAPFSDTTRAEVTRRYQAASARKNGTERSSFLSAQPAERKNGNEPVPHNDRETEEPLFVAVVKAGSNRFGLVVDAVMNTEEVVVKPMHGALKALSCFAGATILGDGSVALILGIDGLARHAGVRFEVAPPPPPVIDARATESQTVLLFRSGPLEQFAMPLALVRRIELIRAERLEQIGGEEFITVDGISTPVLRLDRYMKVSPCPDRPGLFLLLPRNLARPLGVLFSEVVDTLDVPLEINSDAYRADGLLGSALVRGQMTLFLDVFRLADRSVGVKLVPTPSKRRRVLLVEDTGFFRQLVKSYLEAQGFEVQTARDGVEGLECLNAGRFDLVVSDIEMPRMDGWEFARAVRQRADGATVPLLALTTLSGDADRERARECGFDRHEVKLDRERFLSAVTSLLSEREFMTPDSELGSDPMILGDVLTSPLLPGPVLHAEAEPSPYCTFRLGEALYGLDVSVVQSVNVLPALTLIPHGPPSVRGYANLRGQIHLVVDLKRLLGLGGTELGPDTRLVLLKPILGDPFGVLVDQVGDILNLRPRQIEDRRPAEDGAKALGADLVRGVGKPDNELLILLDAHQLLPCVERSAATVS